jgi:hypothetical protein
MARRPLLLLLLLLAPAPPHDNTASKQNQVSNSQPFNDCQHTGSQGSQLRSTTRAES